MLVIRLQRVGKKKQASFRVVLQERSWKPQGKIKELLGFYNPHSKEKKFQAERVQYWLSKGAQPSPTVHNIFVDADLIKGPKKKAWAPKRKSSEASAKDEKTVSPEVVAEEETKSEQPEKEKVAEAEASVEKKPAVEAKSEDTPIEEQKKKEQEEPKEPKSEEELKSEEKPKDKPPKEPENPEKS